MLSGARVLLTGASGQIGSALCRHLAHDNEIWAVARWTDSEVRAEVDASGAITRTVDLADPVWRDVPTDVDYVVHLAAFLYPRDDHDLALRTTAEATALLLQRYAGARAALVMSTTGVYRPHADPWHAYREDDPLGDPVNPAIPTYGIAKVAEEAVARSCARLFGLPVVIARMNAAYGYAGLPHKHLQRILAGEPVVVRNDPAPYSPFFDRDIADQLEAVLGAASVPATILNWGGDEAVSAQEWCAFLGELTGRPAEVHVDAVPGSQPGIVLDVTRCRELTGPCATDWRSGMRQMYDLHLARRAVT